MSFLSSVLSSIETGKPASLPPKPSRPNAPVVSPATAPKPDSRKSTPSAPVSSRPTTNNTTTGIKRKADDPLRQPERPSPSTTNGNELKARPKAPIKAPTTNASRPVAAKPAPSAAPSKPPPKGSFAELMAKAQAVQKEAPKVGVLKHQAALPKEKISKSEKKRRIEAMAKKKEAPKKSGAVGTAASRSDIKPNTVTIKKREQDDNAYKGTARGTQPAQPAYKGTSNLPARHKDAGRDRRRAPRRDEYLGTDEEDEGDYYGGYDDYYSDESSDMEAGLGDMEEEEYETLRTAQKEDAEDIRMEAAAKKAKLERKQKLEALARSKR